MTQTPSLFGLPPDGVARYIPPDEFEQRFRRVEFSVPIGTTLLAFRQRELLGRWPPGTHAFSKTLGDMLKGILLGHAAPVQGWLVRTVPLDVDCPQVGGLFSSDNLPFVASFALRVQVSDPLQFVNQVAWGRQQVRAEDLARLVSPHAEALLAVEVKSRLAQECASPSLCTTLEGQLRSTLQPPLQSKGLLLLDLAQPLRLVCPAQGKRALEEFLLSQEAEEVRRLSQRASYVEEKAAAFRRIQQMIAQMAQDEALTQQQLEEIRRRADRARVLSEEEWHRFLQEMEVARERDQYQKRAAMEIARLEAEYQVKEARLRLDGQLSQANQDILRKQQEQALQWRIRQARLEEEVETARLEAEEHRKTLRILEEQRRHLERERLFKELHLLDEEYRRRQQAMEEAFHRERQKQEELVRLELEQVRAQQEEELRQQAQQKRMQDFHQLLQIITEKIRENPNIRPALLTIPLIITFPEQAEAVRSLTKQLEAFYLSEGKIALLEGQKEAFIAWAQHHYGALGEVLRTHAHTIKTVDDLLQVVERFLGPPSAGPQVSRPNWSSVVPRCSPGVLLLHGPRGFGTAFTVRAEGKSLLVTSAHNLADGVEACVVYWNGAPLPVEVLLRREDWDLALLRPLVDVTLPALSLAESPAHPGDEVGVLGFPLAPLQPLRAASPRFSQGVVSGTWFGPFPFPLLHLTAPVNPGNSGGPALNGQGKVVGVVAGSITSAQGMNLAIPLLPLTDALAMARHRLGEPPRWQALSSHGLLLLAPKGQWQVEPPPGPAAPLVITETGVAMAAVAVQAPTPQDALHQGLSALGHIPAADAESQVAEEPYWMEVAVRQAAPPAIFALRYDPATSKGVVAWATPLRPSTTDWEAQAIRIIRSLYPA